MTMSPKYSPFIAAPEPRRSRTGLRRAAEGNESTSVGPFFFRNVSFIRAISASLTRQTVTPASSAPSSFFTRRRNDSSGRRARRTARWRFTIILAGFLYLVLSRTLSPGLPLCRLSCLRRAGGDLRFVENHEGIVQRAPAHESQRRNLDDSLFQKAFQLVRVEHVVKRVVQWAHVRVDLLLQRPRQKTQSLARFHRRPRQNNAVYLLRQQRAHGHRHRDVCLARAAWTDPKHHVVLLDLFHVAALAGIFRSDLFLAEGTRAAVLKHPPR